MSTTSRWTRMILAGAIASLVVGSLGFAQSTSTEEGKRKVKTRVAPAYPELAKRMNVAGKVKIEVVITPDGHVKSARVVGGHPLLVQACEDAVKEWKFMPANEESTQVVECEYHTGN